MRDRDVDTQGFEYRFIARVVDAGDGLANIERDLGHLADDEVVFIFARDGDDDIGAGGAGALENGRFRSIAVNGDTAQLLVEVIDFEGITLDQEDFIAFAEQGFGEVEADFTATYDDDVHVFSLR